MIARLIRGPAEGWLAVVLVFVMSITVALAIDDVAWVLGRASWTDMLPLCAALGTIAGIAGAKLGWRRWTTHLVGALFAGLLIPIFAGLVLDPGSSPAAAFRVTAEGAWGAYVDLVIDRRTVTTESAHYLVGLGIVAWATGQFGAYAVFGRRRPLNAVVVMGIVLLANMALTYNDQLRYLVVFAAASLFLLISMHAFDERTTWLRRRIGDPSELSGLYFRGGSLFVAVALVGSMFLTDRAASDPLAGAWEGLGDQLIEWSEGFQGFVPTGGATRGGTVSFGSTTRIPATWNSDQTVAFRVTLPPSEIESFYWRAGTWDAFDAQRNEWVQSDGATAVVPSGVSIIDGLADVPRPDLTREVTVTIRPDSGYRTGGLLSPASPYVIDRDVTVSLIGADGWFSSMRGGSGRAPYTVTALVPIVGNDGWNANALRAAGTDYPADVLDRYAQPPGDALGPDARALLDEILIRTGQDPTPYDLAATMTSYLRSPDNFTYTLDLTQYECSSISVAECFARYRAGFCIYYASTMILLLREMGIPARLAQGFLPGDPVLGTREVVVQNQAAHAWVEVYFPGWGWQAFDPTGSVGQLDPLPAGPANVTPTPTTDPNAPRPTPRQTPRGDNEPDDSSSGGGGTINRPGSPTPYITMGVLLALAVLLAVVAAWWYGPRGEVSADVAWKSLGRLAGRFGFAPRPTQTVYEYAATLGDAVPQAVPDLETVARAKVEVAYGRGSVTGDRLLAVREASRRLRLQLLRLALPGRRPRSRRR